MKIVSVEAIPLRIPLKPERRMITALGKHDVSDFVLVRVRTDSDYEGVGEATVTPNWSGETVWGATAMLNRLLGPAVVGLDPTDIELVERRLDTTTVDNWFSKAAIEMACWDIAGRAANKPVYEMLGGAVRSLTIPNRFSLGAYAPAVAAQRAAERVAAGFTTIKVKTGVELESDVARVLAVREAIGPKITMTIDSNGGWNDASARWCLPRMESAEIKLVEQPLPRGNYSELAKLRADLGVRILADESCFDEVEARELVAHKCCDAISLYPGKNGGIAKSKRIAEFAEGHGIPCSIGSNLEFDVGAAAMLHLIVATKNMQVDKIPGDCLGPFYHEVSIAKNPLVINGPQTTLHAAPGLGIDVDWGLVEKLRLKD